MTNCTDLEEEVLDEALGQDLLEGDPAEVGPLLTAPVYGQLRFLSRQDGYWGVNEHTSDEMMGPTRGTDWDDAGIWRVLHTHTWDPFHAFIETAWDDLSVGIARSNVALNNLSQFPESEEINLFTAEVRFLRAWFAFLQMDMFGQLPFREFTDQEFTIPAQVLNRAAAAELIETELLAVIPQLSTKATLPYGRVSQAAARALLAKLYLNWEVYTGQAINTDGVIAQCNAIINSGDYALNPDYFGIFSVNNGQNYTSADEAIFVSIFDSNRDLGQNRQFFNMTLHYSHNLGNPSFEPWNGFTTIADFYNRWDADGDLANGITTNDVRYQDESVRDQYGINLGFLEGQQFGVDGTPLQERNDGPPLVYTVDLPINGASEGQGVRVVKYEPDNQTSDQGRANNDFVFLRMGDVYLMRAEAYLRGGDAGLALADLNTLRAIRNADPLTSATEDAVLNERGFELYWEGWRRNDLIRFGRFNADWTNKGGMTPVTRELFSIPQIALDVNPNLRQNDGY